MNKTMWDCRLGNMNGFTGFNGGFMNSCWGGGFQMPMWAIVLVRQLMVVVLVL